MPSLRSLNVAFLFIAGLCVGVYASASVAAPDGSSSPVRVIEVKQILLAPQTWVAGTVISRHEALLTAEVAGNLVQVKDVGSRVKEDAVVARIDPTFIKLKIEEFESQVEVDRARLEFLKIEWERNKHLIEKNEAAQIRLDELRADREAARNELRISRMRLKQARGELRQHVLRTPFTGVVTERLMRRGERVEVGDAVVRVIDRHALEVQAQVAPETLDFVHAGDLLTIEVNGQEISAPVRALAAAGDVRISLSDDTWTVGQPVRVALPTAKAEAVLAVPRAALVLSRDNAFVFRIDAQNKAQRVAVTVGVASGDLVAVSGGLKAGDRVVIQGGEHLRPDSLVNILDDVPVVGVKKAH